MKPPAITGNRELVEYFIQYLDANFREALNSRLSLQGHLRVDALGRSHVKDLYALDQVVQKTVDLVSDKTIARALQHSATPGVSEVGSRLKSTCVVHEARGNEKSRFVARFREFTDGYEHTKNYV